MTALFCLFAPLAFAAPDPAWVEMRDGLVRDASEAELHAWEIGTDWQKRVLAMDVRAWQFDRAVASLAWTEAPAPYRNGLLRFADPRLQVADAAGPILARLVWGKEPEPVRVALAEAVTRAGKSWGGVVAAMLPAEADALVRTVLVEDGRYADPASALQLVHLGFEDNAAPVRAAAARTAAWITPPTAVKDGLLTSLDDPDAAVRAEAARTVGYLDVEGGWQPLVKRLADSDAGVRLAALKALQHLDSASAATLPEVQVLRQDKDTRVQRAAMGSSGGE